MTTEEIPKLLFIDEDIQQLCDKRLVRKQIIDTKNNKNKVSKSWQYKFHSQIKLASGYQLEAQPGGGQKKQQIEDNSIKTSIFNAIYCNKAGKLFYNSKKGLAVYDIKQLQVMVKTGNTPTPAIVSQQCGSLFLSPNQTKLLVLNSDNICIYSVEGAFTLIKKIQNQFTFTNACWENEEYVYLWSFLNPLYYLMPSTGELVGINDIERCTGVNRINQNFIAAFELLQQEGGAQNAFLYLYKQRIKIKRIQISTLQNPDNPLFQFLTFIGIAKLNNIQQLQLAAEDLYVVSAVYYRAYKENDPQACHRYLFFMQGNLHDDSIKVRKHQLINSSHEKQQLYIDEEKDKKFAFTCIFYHFDTFVTVLFQKSQQVYFIDATQKFQKLNKYQTWPKHIFKINPQKAPNNPYFKAIIPFRNMLQFQRQPPADTKAKELIYYNQQYKGQFLQLYFEHKETTLTFEFPPSIICLTDDYLFKKYAAYIADNCEQQQKIQEFVKQKKRSRYILPISQKIQIQNIQGPQQKQATMVKQQDKKQPIKDKQQTIKQQQSQNKQPVQIKQQIIKQNQAKQEAKSQKESNKPIEPKSQGKKIQKQDNKKIEQPKDQGQGAFKLFSQINQNKPVNNMFASTTASNIFAGNTLFNKPVQVKSTISQKDGIKNSFNFNLQSLSLASKPNEQKQDSSKKYTIKGVQEKKTSFIFGNKSQPGNFFGMGTIPNKVQENNLIKSQPKNSLQQKQKKQVQSQGLFSANIGKETSIGLSSVFAGSAQPQPFNKNQSLKIPFNIILPSKPIQLSDATKSTLKPNQQTKIFTSPNIPNSKPKQPTSTFAKQPQQQLKKNQTITKQVNIKQTQLKIKLQDFKKQINLVNNKIDSYKSDQKTPVLFNLTNAKNLIQKWNQIFEAPFEKSFDEIGKVLIKIDKYEKFQKNRILKKLNEENNKSQVIKNYKQINKAIDSLCYFVSFFSSNHKGQNNDNSTFRSVLKKPYIQNKKQQQKFISALTKNIKDIQKCSQGLNRKYKSELDKQTNKQRKSSKRSSKLYKFDVNLQSQDSQSEPQLQETLFYKYQKQRQKRQQDRYLKQIVKSGQITSTDLIETLQKYQSIVQYVDNPKPLFTYTPLQQAFKPKQNQKSKLSQPQKIGSMMQTAKPFDSKLIQMNVKKQDKRVIPNLQGTQIQKNKSIAGSEKADQQFEDLQIPNASLRTISKVPLFVPPKKQQNSAIFGSFGSKDKKNLKQQELKPKIFQNNPSKATLFEAPKQKQKQPIFGLGIKKQGKNQQQQVTNKAKIPQNLLKDNTQNQKKSQKKQQATTISSLPIIKKTQQIQKPLFGSSFGIGSLSFGIKNQDKKIESKIGDLSKQKQPSTIIPKKAQQKIQNSKSITNFAVEQKKTVDSSLPFSKESTDIKNQQNVFANKPLFTGNLLTNTVSDKNTSNLNKSQIKTDTKLQDKKDLPSTTVTETKQPPKTQQKQTSLPIKKQNPILQQPNTQVSKQQKKSTQSTSQSQLKFPTQTKISQPQPQINSQAKPTSIDFKSISTTQNNSFLKMNQNSSQAQLNKNSSQSTQPNLFYNNQQSQQQQNNAFNNQQNQPMNSFMQSHASTTFGGGNRFMANPTATNVSGNQTGFNPNQMKFGSGTSSNLKSFSSFGASGDNVFGNKNQQSQGWLSSANNMQNNSWLNSGAGTQDNQQKQQGGSWLQNNNQQQQGMATQQNNSWLTNTNQNQSNAANQFNQFNQGNQGNTGAFQSSFNQMIQQPWAQSSTPNVLSNNNFNQGTIQAPSNVSQTMFQPRK